MQNQGVVRLGSNIIVLPEIHNKNVSILEIKCVLDKLEYWFKRYADGFYKFMEPCQHFLHKTGDSWTEELGCSRKVFIKVFDTIGIRYKSKSEFLGSENKFKGKLYASYYDRQTRQTQYVRNHEYFTQITTRLAKFTSAKPQDSVANSKSEGATKTATVSKGRSRNCPISRSPIYKETILTKHNPLSPPKAANAALGDEVILKLIKVWQECTADKTTTASLRNRQKQQLLKAFKETCQDNLDIWKNFCRMIAANKLLNGQISSIGWKISLSWLLRAKNFAKIMQGKYGLNINKIYHIDKSPELSVQQIIAAQQSRAGESEILGDYQDILNRLAKTVDGNSLSSWFNRVNYVGITEETAVFQAPNQFIAANIETRFGLELLEACRALGASKVVVQSCN